LKHPLDSAYAQTERAIEQIVNLNDELTAFLKLQPYKVIGEPDPDAPESAVGLIARGSIEKELPLRFSVLTGEIVHNLRTVFDHIVWQLVIANGRSGNYRTGFPVCETPKEFETRALGKYRYIEGRQRPEGKIERVSPEAQAVIESLQPYNTAKRPKASALYRLHHLDRIHKHRSLHIVGCAAMLHTLYIHRSWYDRDLDGRLPVRSMRFRFPRIRTWEGKPVIPFEDGAELFRVWSKDPVDMQQEISFTISFEEPGVVQAQPVVPTLNDLLSFTASTFDTFLMRFFPKGVEGAHQADPSDPK